ncbi:hypothetical protein NLI96_g993 [Meripilus lineatus]|uniref:WD repeat-containing protein 8 n=1 Tax=Meripilus lineatus TaxID=2056292 RepID=A0AAD5VDB9_9APHY|nr:hypothetical protein NLI96_g993 [Physisporinus lineatus]
MDFTEIYGQSAGLVAFSPGAHFILTAVQDRVIIRRADSFQIARTWHADVDTPQSSTNIALPTKIAAGGSQGGGGQNVITHAGWSSDSEYILAACAKKGTVTVFKLRDETWNARIDAGAEGLVKAEWAPDGRTILIFSSWGLRVTIWSLVSGSPTYINFPLHPDRGYAFRNDGYYFVLAERHKSRDTIGVYECGSSYRMVRHFPLPTSNLSSLSLSPTGNCVAVWEGPLEYKLYILTLAGNLIGTFQPDPDPGFGIRTCAWHPTGNYLAVAGWDDKVCSTEYYLGVLVFMKTIVKVYILESLSWGPVAVLDPTQRLNASVMVWREPLDWIEKTHGRGFLSYERLQPPYSLPYSRPDNTKANPKAGAVQLSFNVTGSLLLARFESSPTTVFLFAFPSLTESGSTNDPTSSSASVTVPKLRSVLLHSNPVTAAKWNPLRKSSLAVCCGSGSLYLWSDEWIGDDEDSGESEEVAECVGVPARQFETRDVRWSPDGKGLVLLDKDTFCCAFEVEEPEEDIVE